MKFIAPVIVAAILTACSGGEKPPQSFNKTEPAAAAEVMSTFCEEMELPKPCETQYIGGAEESSKFFEAAVYVVKFTDGDGEKHEVVQFVLLEDGKVKAVR